MTMRYPDTHQGMETIVTTTERLSLQGITELRPGRAVAARGGSST